MSRLKAAPPPGPACKDTAPNAGVAPTGPVGAVRSHHCPSGHPFPLLSEAGRASPTHPLSKHNEGPTCASTVLGKVYRGAERRYGLCPQEADNLLRKAAIAKRAHVHVIYYLCPHLRHQCVGICALYVWHQHPHLHLHHLYFYPHLRYLHTGPYLSTPIPNLYHR